MSINQFMPQPSMVNLPYTPDPYLANVLIGADMEIMPPATGWNIGSMSPTGLVNTGNVALSTVDPKFGDRSLFFSARRKSLHWPVTNSNFNCSAVSFTQSFWVKRDTGAHTLGHYLISHGTNSTWSEPTLVWESSGRIHLKSPNVTSRIFSGVVPYGEWAHVAWGANRVGSTSTYYLYINGILQGTWAVSSMGSAWSFTLGAPGWDRGGDYTFIGNIDEFRWWKGVSIYDGVNNFTPPPAPWQK